MKGREQGRVVRRYLEALESHRPKRGARRTPESITERMDLEQELGTVGGEDDDLSDETVASGLG